MKTRINHYDLPFTGKKFQIREREAAYASPPAGGSSGGACRKKTNSSPIRGGREGAKNSLNYFAKERQAETDQLPHAHVL